MSRIDHVAYRVKNRDDAVKFFVDAFGYKIQAEFEIFFNDEKTDKALCMALEPPEKLDKDMPWVYHVDDRLEYHLAPEIFVSEGTIGSIVFDWVEARNGIGGAHHIAYQVDSVAKKMAEWTEKGYGDFTTKDIMTCPGLKQVFSKPHRLTGMIYEFIEREEFGFCAENVKQLMESTRESKVRIDAFSH